MSRSLRIEYPGAWYHVMKRGRQSESVFSDKHDGRLPTHQFISYQGAKLMSFSELDKLADAENKQ